jgi:ATP-dependent DNA helicase RecG
MSQTNEQAFESYVVEMLRAKGWRQGSVTADLERTVDNARMRQITGGHAADITRVLQGLVGKKALAQEGQGRWTRYRLPVSPDSIFIIDHYLHKESDSLPKSDHSLHKGADSIHNAELLMIAAPARQQPLLRLRYPEKPNRTDQAYSTASEGDDRQ